MNRTKIEWTDYSWNPITGCLHGCWYCYAKKITQRFKKNFPKGFNPTFYPDKLHEPYNLKKPSKIFVCSIADLFASWTPTLWRDAVLESIFHCPVKHTFQLLTKNPERIPKTIYPKNVWIGATVEDQEATWRVGYIKTVKCGIRFISFEPLLAPITAPLKGIDWVIIGKLTGSRKAPIKRGWIEAIQKECERLGIPIFMKNNLKQAFPNMELIQEFPK